MSQGKRPSWSTCGEGGVAWTAQGQRRHWSPAIPSRCPRLPRPPKTSWRKAGHPGRQRPVAWSAVQQGGQGCVWRAAHSGLAALQWSYGGSRLPHLRVHVDLAVRDVAVVVLDRSEETIHSQDEGQGGRRRRHAVGNAHLRNGLQDADDQEVTLWGACEVRRERHIAHRAALASSNPRWRTHTARGRAEERAQSRGKGESACMAGVAQAFHGWRARTRNFAHRNRNRKFHHVYLEVMTRLSQKSFLEASPAYTVRCSGEDGSSLGLAASGLGALTAGRDMSSDVDWPGSGFTHDPLPMALGPMPHAARSDCRVSGWDKQGVRSPAVKWLGGASARPPPVMRAGRPA